MLQSYPVRYSCEFKNAQAVKINRRTLIYAGYEVKNEI
jgi:hypothetical protein